MKTLIELKQAAESKGLRFEVNKWDPTIRRWETDKVPNPDFMKIEIGIEYRPNIWAWFDGFCKEDVKDDDKIALLVQEYLKEEKERYHMEKRLKCLMNQTRFTPARLQEEFPEAYLIYIDIITADLNEKNDDAKKPASNLCDTIENIRATLKPDLKETLKNAKTEE